MTDTKGQGHTVEVERATQGHVLEAEIGTGKGHGPSAGVVIRGHGQKVETGGEDGQGHMKGHLLEGPGQPVLLGETKRGPRNEMILVYLSLGFQTWPPQTRPG